MKNRKKKKKNSYSSIASHKREKSKLITPLNQLNTNLVEWERDLLPEHLWIELLATEYKELSWHRIYNDFLDKLEESLEDKQIMLYGYITDFGLIPEKSRIDFITKHKEFIYNSFFKPIGKILTLYPESPANWLVLEEWKNEETIDFETELNKLSSCLIRLYNAKNLHTGNIRAVALNRLFKHNKLFLFKGMSVIDLLPKYPDNCTDDEKYSVQSFARNTMNMEYMQNQRYEDRKWPKYFWRHNYDLIPCVPNQKIMNEDDALPEDNYTILSSNIESNSNVICNYISKLSLQYKYDLYFPDKDEILLGLFSRLSRLYIVYLTGTNLWSRDISGIFLRCYVDTAITFAYLVLKGSELDFTNFKKYSDGKEKLLMLHLQDSFENEKSIENLEYEQIADDLGGGMNPEFIDIELGSWSKKSVYQLAKEAGFEKYYKLIYDPASSDLHGTWSSLKKSNLVNCKMSLHRYHKIPIYFEPPLYLSPIELAASIFLNCYHIGKDHLKFPLMDDEIKDILDKSIS